MCFLVVFKINTKCYHKRRWIDPKHIECSYVFGTLIPFLWVSKPVWVFWNVCLKKKIQTTWVGRSKIHRISKVVLLFEIVNCLKKTRMLPKARFLKICNLFQKLINCQQRGWINSKQIEFPWDFNTCCANSKQIHIVFENYVFLWKTQKLSKRWYNDPKRRISLYVGNPMTFCMDTKMLAIFEICCFLFEKKLTVCTKTRANWSNTSDFLSCWKVYIFCQSRFF